MDEMLNDLLMMRNLGQNQSAGMNVSPSLLDEIRDLAVAEMSEVFSKILERTAVELLDLASRNPSHVMYCLYMDTREQVQSQQQALVSTFRRRLFQRFNEAGRRGHLPQETQTRLDASQLNLVEPEELELTLASSTISHALRIACHDELPGLDRRMGVLLEDPDLRFGPNPLAPEVIGETLMDAIKELPASNKIRLMLVTRLNLHLPGQIKQVYEKINGLLIGKGVLPSIRLEVRRSGGGATGPRTSGTSPQDSTTPSEHTHPPGGDMFAMLQQLMSMGRIGGAPHLPSLPSLPGGGGAEAANEGEIESAEVVQRLTRIQQGDLDGLTGAQLDPGVLANGQVNVLRAIKHTGAAGNMGHMDAMTLDIVALMFDYILDDPRLPDGMKALIGRLQIPVLKVAMLDKSFFSQKNHPARKLLDALADAALGWNEQEGHDSALYKTVDALVQRVLNEFEDKVDVFSDVLEQLRQFMEEEKRLADERACHSAQILQQNEQTVLAHTLAIEAVQARLLDSDAPESILLFLQGPWADHLADLYLKKGANSDGWDQALSTMDDLLWSLTPKATREEKQKLVTLLPKLLKQLDEGIRAVGLNQAERDRFFANLVKYHAEAVKADPLGGGKTASIGKARSILSPVPPRMSFAFDSPDLHDIPSPSTKVETDSRILREISAPLDLQDEAEEIIIADVVGQERLPAEDDGVMGVYEGQVRQLKRGTWLEFTLEDGTSLRAKLAWISPLRGTYLFTNRLGERAVSINAAGLAHKLREGSAKIVDNVALIDRAVNSLFERLQKSS